MKMLKEIQKKKLGEGKYIRFIQDQIFFEILVKNFYKKNSIVLVEAVGEKFEEVFETEDIFDAMELGYGGLDEGLMSFRKIEHDYIEYGDWSTFKKVFDEVIDTEEANLLKTIYFDCKEFEDVVGVVILYYKKTFVTMIYKEEW